MSKLRSGERRGLLNAAKKIHTHKLAQIKGFQILVKKAKHKKMKQLLTRISDDEKEQVEFWSEKIKDLGSRSDGVIKAYLRDYKTRLMMTVLGTKGFFEWAVIAEGEGIQDLAVQAEKIRDRITSDTWKRFAADERMHLERMKTEVLGMEGWEIRGGGGVKDMIFGFNDGLVSTLAFVACAFGAFTDPYLILLSGMAELFAGTISMTAGAYESSKSEVEVLERENQKKEVKKGQTPEEERKELIEFYQAEGFKKREAELIVKRIAGRKELLIQPGTLEELGLEPKELGSPVKAGVLCGISFGLAAIVPVLPFVFPALGCTNALTVSVIATLATLFGVGAMKTIFSRRNWVRSGLEMTAIGASATAVTYIIGTLLPF